MRYRTTIASQVFQFDDLKQVMAFASPARSGDYLAGIGAATAQQRMAARHVLADTPLKQFLTEALIPYEDDNITRLIIDGHDTAAFATVAHLTVGDFRNWLLSDHASNAALSALAPGLTPEMVAAASKLMRNQDLIAVARKCSVVTRFRDTIGLPGRLSVRLQPNHPTDDLRGVAASTLDGLLMGAGDAVIGINSRDLETLVIDPAVTTRLMALIPPDRIAIAESGVSTRLDVERVASLGADAVLVGSSISAAPDPTAAVAALTGVTRGRRGG